MDKSVPSTVSPLADLIYSMLPHPKITEILDEVERWTAAFTRHFTHLKNPLTSEHREFIQGYDFVSIWNEMCKEHRVRYE